MGKPGRVLKKIFPEATDLDLDNFARAWHVNVQRDSNDFKIVSGKDIKHWYDEDNYTVCCGSSLNNSCMKRNPEYMELYAINPDKIKMLCLFDDDGYLKGRALVWTEVNAELFEVTDNNKYQSAYNIKEKGVEKEVVLMDRVYVSNDKDTELFIDYAKKEGWMYKDRQSYDDDVRLWYKGKKYIAKLTVIGLDTDVSCWPYVDTLSYICPEYGVMSNIDQYQKYGYDFYYADSTEGCLEGYQEGVYSEHYNRVIHRDEAYWVEDREDYFYEDDVIGINGVFYHQEDVVYSEYKGRDYPEDECVYSDYMEDYIPNSAATYSRYLSDYIPTGEAVYSEYHESDIYEPDAVYHEETGDYIHQEDYESFLQEYEGKKEEELEEVA